MSTQINSAGSTKQDDKILGSMALNIYCSDGSGNVVPRFRTDNTRHFASALAWLAGNFAGSGDTEIAQLWDNNGRLALVIYGSDGVGRIVTVFQSDDVGQGSGALAWLAGDFTGSNKTEIAQPWDNNGEGGFRLHLLSQATREDRK